MEKPEIQPLDMTAESRVGHVPARLPLLESEGGGGFDAPSTGA